MSLYFCAIKDTLVCIHPDAGHRDAWLPALGILCSPPTSARIALR
jgi:hypothetical protein